MAAPGWRWWRTHQPNPAVLLVAILSFLCKYILIVALDGALKCVSDECQYLIHGLSLAESLRFEASGHLWPPLFPLLIAACHKLFPDSVDAIRVAQALLSSAAIFPLYGIALRAYGRRPALVAVCLFAFFPEWLGYGIFLRPVVLYVLFFLLAVYFLVRRETPDRSGLILAGVCLGLCSLSKAVGLYFLPGAIIWVVIAARRAGDRSVRKSMVAASILAAATFLTISPWSVRNFLQYDRVVLLDLETGTNLSRGQNIGLPPTWDMNVGSRRGRLFQAEGEVRPSCIQRSRAARNACEIRNGIRFALTHPVLSTWRTVLKTTDLLTPANYILSYAQKEQYMPLLSKTTHQALTLATTSTWFFALWLGSWSFVLLRPEIGRFLFGYTIICNLVSVWVTFGTSRFRMTWLPILLIIAAPMLSRDPLAAWKKASPAARGLALLLLALIVAIFQQRWYTVSHVFDGDWQPSG